VPEWRVLLSDLAFPEPPRWHDERLWVSDWGAHEVIEVDLEGASEVSVRVESFPMCIDHLPDGRLLIVSASDRLLLRREGDGSLATHADLTSLADRVERHRGGRPGQVEGPAQGVHRRRVGPGVEPVRTRDAIVLWQRVAGIKRCRRCT
jgi:sugar lactone lactonase YvrE